MFDSASEGELNSTGGTPNIEASADMQILAEARNEQLQEENSSLMKELNQLRAQFEHAMNIANKSQEYRKEYEAMKSKIRLLVEQVEDLEKRLLISATALQDAQEKLAAEKKSNESQRNADVSSMQHELEKTKSSFEEHVEKLTKELEAVKRQKDADEITQKLLVGRVEKLIQNISLALSTDFSSFDALCHYFASHPTIGPKESDDIPKPEVNQIAGSRLINARQKIRKLKAALRQMKSINSSLLQQNESSEYRIKELEQRKNMEIKTIKEKLEKSYDECNTLNLEYKANIKSLNQKIDNLKIELAKKQTASPKVEQQAAPPLPPPIVVQKKEKQKDHMEEIVAEISKQYETINTKYEETLSILKNTVQEKKTLEKKCDQLQNELNSDRIIQEQTALEIKTLRDALHKKPIPADISSQKRIELQQLKASQIKNQNIIETLKRQVYQTQLDFEKLSHEKKELLDKQKDYQNQIALITNSLESYKDENEELMVKVSQIKEVSNEDILPSFVFRGDFDQELTKNIDRIACNPSLTPQSKVQTVMGIILKHFNKQFATQKKDLQTAAAATDELKTVLNDFIVSVSIAICDHPTTIDEIIKSDKADYLVKSANSLRLKLSEEKRRADALQKIVNSYTQKIPFDGEQSQHPQFIFNEIVKFANMTQELKLRNQKLKASLINLERNNRQTTNDSESKLNNLMLENENLRAANSKHAKTISKMRQAVQQAKETAAAAEERATDYEHLSQTIRDSTIAEQQQLLREASARYESMIEQVKEERDDNAERVSSLEAELSALAKTVQTLKAAVSSGKEELKELERESESKLREAAAAAESDRRAVEESGRKAVEELSLQCEQHRADVVRLSAAAGAAEKELRAARERLARERAESARARKEAVAAAESLERARKLLEARARDAELSAESAIASARAESEEQRRSDLRRIAAFAADEFRGLFAPSDALDERGLRSLLTRAGEALRKLSKSDSAIRRITGASPTQPTEDAVARALSDAS